MRLQNYMEDNELYPHSMFGFRAELSTQDVLLQLKEEVLSNVPGNGEHVIMALDIKGAFDNVSHKAILTGMDSLNCGIRIRGYVKAFLSNWTATIGLGEVRSEKFRPPKKGTPLRSVISPILFNIAMIGLARQLEQIKGKRHTMYADDITVWVNWGSLSEKEECLQKAATCVETYVRARGLACSTEKSELLRVSIHAQHGNAQHSDNHVKARTVVEPRWSTGVCISAPVLLSVPTPTSSAFSSSLSWSMGE
ncbi:putative nicotine oxidoreductase [Amblyomma americanum]